MINGKKMMLVVGGTHHGAQVEVEDYTYAVRLPMAKPFELKPDAPELKTALQEDEDAPINFALYYRSSISLTDETDGSTHKLEFLRPGGISIRQAVELVLLPLPPATPGSTLQ